MSWQNFGTSVASGTVAVAVWLLATKVVGDLTTTQPMLALIVRVVATLICLGIFTFAIGNLYPSYFCGTQVAVPPQPPVQTGSPTAPTTSGTPSTPTTPPAGTPSTPASPSAPTNVAAT